VITLNCMRTYNWLKSAFGGKADMQTTIFAIGHRSQNAIVQTRHLTKYAARTSGLPWKTILYGTNLAIRGVPGVAVGAAGRSGPRHWLVCHSIFCGPTCGLSLIVINLYVYYRLLK